MKNKKTILIIVLALVLALTVVIPTASAKADGSAYPVPYCVWRTISYFVTVRVPTGERITITNAYRACIRAGGGNPVVTATPKPPAPTRTQLPKPIKTPTRTGNYRTW